MPSSLFSRSHAVALAALLAAGCGGSSSPEQQLADRHFETARAAFRLGQIRRTHAHLDSALALESVLHRPARVGEIHRLRGTTFAALAEFDSAFAFYRRAIESFRGAADRPAARAVALDIADAEHAMGRDRRAWDQLDESLRLAGVFGEEAGERAIRWAMLPAARAIEDFEAEEKLRAALAKALGGEGDTRGTARLLREEGLALMARGRPEAASSPCAVPCSTPSNRGIRSTRSLR